MALSVSCSCCALVSASAVYCRYLCYLSAVMRQWPLWSNPVPLSLIRVTRVVPLFLRCCIIRHMVLIAQCRKVLQLPLRSYHLYNWISQFWFDNHMKDLGAAQSYLGIRITRDHAHQRIWIDQEAYIDSALSQFCLMDANDTKTPLPAGVHLTKSENPSSTNLRTEYQQLIGTLRYAALGTRPNIAFAVTWLSRFNSDPTEEHLRYAKYVLRYLKRTKSLQICYDRSSNASLIGYSDSDWGENKDDCHSTLGQVFTLANGAISWASQRQKTVALSVGESEYMELASTGCQCAWLRSFSAEIGFPFTQAMTICADNQAAIFLAINPAVEWRTKHIDIRHHYIHEQVATKVIDLYHIAGEENPTDLFTKPLPVVKVEKFRSLIGLTQELKLHTGTRTGDEPGILVWPNTLPFLHFSISALMLTYHDAWNRRGASREHAQCSIFVKSLLLTTPLFGNV